MVLLKKSTCKDSKKKENMKYGHFKSRLDEYVSTRNRFRRLSNSVRWWECVDTIFFIKFYVIKWKILKWRGK